MQIIGLPIVNNNNEILIVISKDYNPSSQIIKYDPIKNEFIEYTQTHEYGHYVHK